MVTAATPMPSDSSAAITMGTAVAPLATLARRRTPSLETSFTPSSRSTAVCARPSPLAPTSSTWIASPRSCAFSSSGVPSTTIFPWSTIARRRASRSASSR